MIGFRIDKAKGAFFDRIPVQGAADKATKKVLSKFGAFVRTRARSSIRTRKKMSDPGFPPSSHTGLLKKFIFFVYEETKNSVIIGPAKLNRPSLDALEMLEYGGTTLRRRNRKEKLRRARYRARPFMRPAHAKELAGMHKLWHNAIKK